MLTKWKVGYQKKLQTKGRNLNKNLSRQRLDLKFSPESSRNKKMNGLNNPKNIIYP